MTRFPTFWHRGNTATRRGLGVLMIVWLNLLITPCAMAFEAEHSCPHDQASAHHEHGQAGQATVEHPCASMEEDCCDVGIASFDARSGDIKLKDTPEAAYVAAPGFAELQMQFPAWVAPVVDPPDPPGAFPPLHVLNCVYLK